jgi:hypothetical protein
MYMTFRFVLLPLAFAGVLSAPVRGQTTTVSVTATLQASLTAMVGQQTITDATLSGQAEYTAGADDETISFTYQATSAGSSRMQLPLAAGTLTETRLDAASGPTGQWQQGDGPVQAMMQHNLLTGACWAFPAFIVNKLLTNTSETVSFVAQEGNLLHFTAYAPVAGLPSAAASLQQNLTGIDLWLDASTLLPAKAAFSIHPDSSAAINIPVLIEYSQYQTLNGVLMPSQIQQFINNTLMLNLQVQSAVFNSGLPPSTFSIQ